MKFVHGSLDRRYRGAKSDLWPEHVRAVRNISKQGLHLLANLALQQVGMTTLDGAESL